MVNMEKEVVPQLPAAPSKRKKGSSGRKPTTQTRTRTAAKTTAAKPTRTEQEVKSSRPTQRLPWGLFIAILLVGILLGMLFRYITTIGAVNTTPTVATPTATPVPTTVSAPSTAGAGTSWTPSQKCKWLRNNFPQTDVGVQAYVAALANVPQQRVTLHKYQCEDGTEVYDGGIINGPVEGYNQPFTISVPYPGSVVDAYPGGTFDGEHFPISASTERLVSGKVTALRATFWAWWDERPPVYVAPAATATPMLSATACEGPQDLATRK